MRIRPLAFLVAGLLGAAAAGAAPPPAQPAAPPADVPVADPNKAEGRFKNIKSFKGYPADDVVPAMQFISNALGEDCEFCHVENAFEKDDKEAKETARKMIAMTFAINRDSFDGHREVTCMSCHHGAARPVSIPIIGGEKHAEKPAAKAVELPAAAAVLDKYVAALGGADAIAKVGSLVQKGSLTGFGPEPISLEVLAKSPDKRATKVHSLRGDNITVVTGQGGWRANGGRPPRDIPAGELEGERLDSALLFPSDLKPLFQEFKVAAGESIDGKDTVKLIGRNEGRPPSIFWFDVQSGLLVRMMRYMETPLGRNPTQVDVADYREIGGVKSPFRWTVGRPGGSFTIQLESSQANTPVADKAFEKPAKAPPS